MRPSPGAGHHADARPGGRPAEDAPRPAGRHPGLAVVTDSFEPRAHRPKRRQRAYDPGKKKAHTLRSQVGVDEDTGRVVDVFDSVPGPWADIKPRKKSRLRKRLPAGVGGVGDLEDTAAAALAPAGLGAAPRKKPRGKDRPPEDIPYHRAFRRRRIVVEHTIGRLRRFRSRPHVHRLSRKGHAARVRAVAGLVARMRDLTAAETASAPKPANIPESATSPRS